MMNPLSHILSQVYPIFFKRLRFTKSKGPSGEVSYQKRNYEPYLKRATLWIHMGAEEICA